ncbi:MAG: cation transporter [Bacteroidetes bacterium]|nr:MAG: cation transporter [Bacteroidota bacterium]
MQKTILVQRWVTLIGLALLGVKFVAYFATHSVAILTDALESIVNVVAGFITLYGLHIAAKPRDANHPYGHGKAEFLSSGIEGALVMVAGILIVLEAAKKLLHPTPVAQLDLGMALVAACGVINFAAGKLALNTSKKYNSIAIGATGRHLISDAISSIGLIAGLLLMHATGWLWLDAAVALLFAAIVIVTGAKIVRRSVAGIMDEADEIILQRMVSTLNKQRRPEWIDFHNLRIIKYGNALHLDCHMTLPWYLNVHEAHQEIDHLALIVRQEFDDTLELFVHTDGCQPFGCNICSMQKCTVREQPFLKQVEWTIDNIFQNQKHSIANAQPR